jgi:hypothetical protein
MLASIMGVRMMDLPSNTVIIECYHVEIQVMIGINRSDSIHKRIHYIIIVIFSW